METTIQKPNKSKFARTFHKVINLRNASKIASNNGICMLATQYKAKEDMYSDTKTEDGKSRNKAVMEALVAKLFASITAIKAAYAELQMAQHPYNSNAIQAADQAVVDELKAISDLKRSFLKKQLDLSPQVTIMLAEIQEQQSLMKTYEIMIKKLESEAESKSSYASTLKLKLQHSIQHNKSLEKKLNSSGCLPQFDNISLSTLNQSHFTEFLNYTLKSVRHFVKQLVREMESANWDINSAIKSIQPNQTFTTQNHKCYALESYVSKTIFEGFNTPNFTSKTQSFEFFKSLKTQNPKNYLSQNPNSSFAKFIRSKYIQLVHAKMECSFFGNLNQRKVVNAGGFPESAFFTAFAEMCRRVWLLRCLAFSFGESVTVFQVRNGCRYSEVYMECVAAAESSGGDDEVEEEGKSMRVGFTVVPGFKIGRTVVQCQVYLSPRSRI